MFWFKAWGKLSDDPGLHMVRFHRSFGDDDIILTRIEGPSDSGGRGFQSRSYVQQVRRGWHRSSVGDSYQEDIMSYWVSTMLLKIRNLKVLCSDFLVGLKVYLHSRLWISQMMFSLLTKTKVVMTCLAAQKIK